MAESKVSGGFEVADRRGWLCSGNTIVTVVWEMDWERANGGAGGRASIPQRGAGGPGGGRVKGTSLGAGRGWAAAGTEL